MVCDFGGDIVDALDEFVARGGLQLGGTHADLDRTVA